MNATQLTKYAQKFAQAYAFDEWAFVDFIKKAFKGADVYYSNYMDNLTLIGVYGDGVLLIKEFGGSVGKSESKTIYDVMAERFKAGVYNQQTYYDWQELADAYTRNDFVSLEAFKTRDGIYIVNGIADMTSRSADVLMDVAMDSLVHGEIGIPNASIIRQYTKRD